MYLQLQVVAYDANRPRNKAYKLVNIQVQRNSGGPAWTLFVEDVKMREDLPQLGLVTKVNATDVLDNVSTVVLLFMNNSAKFDIRVK
jgi:hypothetical protein